MVEFHDFQVFALILYFPFLFLKKLLRNSGNSSFSHPRGQAAQKLVKPMEFHPFLGVLGAFGHNFRNVNFPTEITRNVENMISLLISDFHIESNFLVKWVNGTNTYVLLSHIEVFEYPIT